MDIHKGKYKIHPPKKYVFCMEPLTCVMHMPGGTQQRDRRFTKLLPEKKQLLVILQARFKKEKNMKKVLALLLILDLDTCW